MKPVRVSMNPAIVRLPTGTFAVSGGVWIRVPDDTTRADLPKYMVWERPQSAPEAPQMDRWTVTGSKGDSYRVEAFSGLWRCSCKGYEFRRTCRHIEEVKRDQSR